MSKPTTLRLEAKPKRTKQGAHRVSRSKPNHRRKLLRGQGRG